MFQNMKIYKKVMIEMLDYKTATGGAGAEEEVSE
jgi:hypothetical protein